MAITSYIRGHLAGYLNGKWVYCDNGEPIAQIRPCKKCGKMPTLEGYDACFGYIPNVKWACCGHGVSNPIMVELI